MVLGIDPGTISGWGLVGEHPARPLLWGTTGRAGRKRARGTGADALDVLRRCLDVARDDRLVLAIEGQFIPDDGGKGGKRRAQAVDTIITARHAGIWIGVAQSLGVELYEHKGEPAIQAQTWRAAVWGGRWRTEQAKKHAVEMVMAAWGGSHPEDISPYRGSNLDRDVRPRGAVGGGKDEGNMSETKLSRWRMLSKTSPSGKTMFLCAVCKRESTTPDKECPAMDCAGIERRMRNNIESTAETPREEVMVDLCATCEKARRCEMACHSKQVCKGYHGPFPLAVKPVYTDAPRDDAGMFSYVWVGYDRQGNWDGRVYADKEATPDGHYKSVVMALVHGAPPSPDCGVRDSRLEEIEWQCTRCGADNANWYSWDNPDCDDCESTMDEMRDEVAMLKEMGGQEERDKWEAVQRAETAGAERDAIRKRVVELESMIRETLDAGYCVECEDLFRDMRSCLDTPPPPRETCECGGHINILDECVFGDECGKEGTAPPPPRDDDSDVLPVCPKCGQGPLKKWTHLSGITCGCQTTLYTRAEWRQYVADTEREIAEETPCVHCKRPPGELVNGLFDHGCFGADLVCTPAEWIAQNKEERDDDSDREKCSKCGLRTSPDGHYEGGCHCEEQVTPTALEQAREKYVADSQWSPCIGAILDHLKKEQERVDYLSACISGAAHRLDESDKRLSALESEPGKVDAGHAFAQAQENADKIANTRLRLSALEKRADESDERFIAHNAGHLAITGADKEADDE